MLSNIKNSPFSLSTEANPDGERREDLGFLLRCEEKEKLESFWIFHTAIIFGNESRSVLRTCKDSRRCYSFLMGHKLLTLLDWNLTDFTQCTDLRIGEETRKLYSTVAG